VWQFEKQRAGGRETKRQELKKGKNATTGRSPWGEKDVGTETGKQKGGGFWQGQGGVSGGKRGVMRGAWQAGGVPGGRGGHDGNSSDTPIKKQEGRKKIKGEKCHPTGRKTKRMRKTRFLNLA